MEGHRRRTHVLGALLLCAGVLAPTFADAHFVLLAPESWMSQDAYGFPLKLGPCGDEGGGTPTGVVTPFQPGETIAVTINEVIAHPGHYRVALAVNDRSELPAEPVVTPTAEDQCASAAIEDPAVFPVLADDVLAHTQPFSAPQTFYVTLPSDVTCTKCTLQVLEFMSSHGAPCFYHHCADISIGGTPVYCGDGQVQLGEDCDDGNTANGDGCDAACRFECGTITASKLGIGKLAAPAGDETLGFQGVLTLPAAVSAALDPLTSGVRLTIVGATRTVADATIRGGAGWTVNATGAKWTYRDKTPAPAAGIAKVMVRRTSAVSDGIVKVAIKGRAGSFAVTAADLPVTARMTVVATSAGCGAATFVTCAFSGSGKTLKCK